MGFRGCLLIINVIILCKRNKNCAFRYGGNIKMLKYLLVTIVIKKMN